MGKKDKITPEWAREIASRVIAAFPERDTYVGAAGISPSGPIHFGNFRDVSTTLAVLDAIKETGKQVRFVYSWDDYDRFRKVPAGVPEEWSEHVGKPLSAVPDPEGKFGSYAERFEQAFEQDMAALGLELEYLRQTELYAAGTYDDLILKALAARETIADILFSLMSDKAKQAQELTAEAYRESYYPVSVYSRFTGKDSTKVTGFDGKRTLTYYCAETKQDDTVEIGKDRLVKLGWKVDWPMRWVYEQVAFEPGGMDHASPGSSFDAGDRIAKEVFGYEPPLHAAYGFVGIQGQAGKMSGSAGTGVTIGELLGIYEPELLKWLYYRKQPKQYFNLAFDTEIYRQYDEYDRKVATPAGAKPMPFRQAVAFGQIVSWDRQKISRIIESLGTEYDPESIDSRLPRAKTWLDEYNPDERIALLDQPNAEYAKKLSAEQKKRVAELRQALTGNNPSPEELESLVYAIPKDTSLPDEENKPRQRAFFADVYNLLIGRDAGPRLATFLWAADRDRVLALLDI